MDSYDLAEMIEANWGQVPKDQVQVGTNVGNKTPIVTLFSECGDVRLYVALSVGIRGGIKETVVVLDTTGRILADRILFCALGAVRDGALTNLSELHQIRKGENVVNLCKEELESLLARIQKNREFWEKKLRHFKHESTGTSAGNFLRGGAPSLGKRR